MREYQYDYSKLKGKMVEVAGTMKNMAKLMGVSEMTMHYRMHDQFPFTSDEILRLCELLKIPKSKIPVYFFTTKVSK